MAEKYTHEEERLIIEMREAGATWPEIGLKLGRSAKTLSAKYQKMTKSAEKKPAPNKRPDKKSFNPEDPETIVHIKATYEETYDKYRAVRRLAREYGVKPIDIFMVLKANGVIGKERKSGEPFSLEEAKEEKPEPEPETVLEPVIEEPVVEDKPKIERHLHSYTVSVTLLDASFESLDEVQSFLNSLEALNGMVEDVEIFELNRIEIKE